MALERIDNRPLGGRRALPQSTETASSDKLPWLVKISLIALLIPAYFSLGPLSMSPSRALFLVLLPILLINLLRGAYGRIVPPDILIILYSTWMAIAMLANHSPLVAIEYTGSNIVILLGGYLVARAGVRNSQQFTALAMMLALIVLVSLPFAIYETLTSRTTIPRWLASLPSISSHPDINHDPRLGLWRVQWVFVHPIHYGLFCSLAFAMIYVGMMGQMAWIKRMGIALGVFVCCFLSVSSGPVLALACQIGLIGWLMAMFNIKARWRILGLILLLAYIVIEIASDRPGLYAVVERLSFNSANAYVRRILFNYGMAQIGQTPLFGVGFNPWNLPDFMTGSVDNFWLFLALVFGLPAFFFFTGAFLYAMIRMGWRDFDDFPILVAQRRAWMFTMISLCLTLATVAVWAEMYSIVLFIFGSGMWMLNVAPEHPNGEEKVEAAPERASQYTRFAYKDRSARTARRPL